MKIQKHIDNAIKDINHAIEWESKEKQDAEMKFWLEHFYLMGKAEQFRQERYPGDAYFRSKFGEKLDGGYGQEM